MDSRKKPCRECGKPFTSWRRKSYCSEPCRKRAENRRLKGLEIDRLEERAEASIRGDGSPTLADTPKVEKIVEEKQGLEEHKRGDEPPSYRVHHATWIAINEITDKLQYRGTAIGWAMRIERGNAWFGRVRDERGNFSFGPSSRTRARKTVETWIKHEPIEKLEGEATWNGDCLDLV